ncbi:hypothetical protein BH10CHL1_BH10CHL1_49180 [soil metagenome]
MITFNSTPWILWPFVALWRLLAGILALTGRLLGVVLGLVLLIVGFVISLTVIGAVIGIPLIALGLLLMVRGLF